MVVTIIGIGLIGGSFAIALKEKALADKVIGVDNNPEHVAIALEKGIVDVVLPLEEAIAQSQLIVLAIPVIATAQLLPEVLSQVNQQVVIDMGSTKSAILAAVDSHEKRSRFVATHPMWGTEFSGPSAAVSGAFVGKATVICDADKADSDVLQLVESIYKRMGMHIVYMEGQSHDVHVAYVSHISHITSFALANTVLEKEKEEDAIFDLASAGFESTVRLAKSNAATWVPIFRQNRENVLDVLNEHISQLRKFKACLEKENYEYLANLITQANQIRKVLERPQKQKSIK